MAYYIDKAALVAEIERRISQLESKYKELSKFEIWITAKEIEHKINGLKEALSIVNTLEVIEDTKSVFEGQYLSKDKVVTTIERLQDKCEEHDDNNDVELLEELFNKLDTLEVKEVDLDALGVLAEHLIACDAHLVTPKYTDKELNMLEEWARNNKTQKRE